MCLITEIVGDEESDEIFLHTKIIIYWYGWIIEIYEIFNFSGQNCGLMEFSKMIYSEGLVFKKIDTKLMHFQIFILN